MSTSLKKYTKILEVLKIDSLDREDQEEMLLDLNDLVVKGALVRIIEKMDDKTRVAFSKLLSSDASEEEVEAFIKKHVPDPDDAVFDTLAELTDDILAVTK